MRASSLLLVAGLVLSGSSAVAQNIAVLGDVEGMWDRWEHFATTSGAFSSTSRGYDLKPGYSFVFQGDAVDRGAHSRQVLETFLRLKNDHPSDVVMLLGNRDINKLRLLVELDPKSIAQPDPSYEKVLADSGLPRSLRTDPITKLKFILDYRMGSPEAFEFRRDELKREGRASTDADVLKSYLEDLKFDGLQGRYLRAAQIAHVDEKTGTLFVHGAVTEKNFGLVPGRSAPETDVRKWVKALNEWARKQIEAATKDGLTTRSNASELVDYQRRVGQGDQNPFSVVSARFTDDMGLPKAPSEKFLAMLAGQGIRRVSVGHSPYGEVPIVLRPGGFEIVLADVSYNKLGKNFPVMITSQGVTAESSVAGIGQVKIPAVSDNGIGGRLETGEVVVGELANGNVLTFKSVDYVSIHSEISGVEAKARIRSGRCQDLLAASL